MGGSKSIQAKHIPDVMLLAAITRLRTHKWGVWMGVMRGELEAEFSGIPPKVLLAKCSALIRRKLLDGCDCGCGGAFTLTDAGEDFLRGYMAPRYTVEIRP